MGPMDGINAGAGVGAVFVARASGFWGSGDCTGIWMRGGREELP